MQELINKLISEAGLSAEQAQKALDTVVAYVKTKVPSALAGNIDAMFSGIKAEVKEESYKEKAEDFAKATKEELEELAENTKEKLEELAGTTKDRLEDFAETAKKNLSEAADKAEDFAKDAFGKIKGMFNNDNTEKKA